MNTTASWAQGAGGTARAPRPARARFRRRRRPEAMQRPRSRSTSLSRPEAARHGRRRSASPTPPREDARCGRAAPLESPLRGERTARSGSSCAASAMAASPHGPSGRGRAREGGDERPPHRRIGLELVGRGELAGRLGSHARPEPARRVRPHERIVRCEQRLGVRADLSVGPSRERAGPREGRPPRPPRADPRATTSAGSSGASARSRPIAVASRAAGSVSTAVRAARRSLVRASRLAAAPIAAAARTRGAEIAERRLEGTLAESDQRLDPHGAVGGDRRRRRGARAGHRAPRSARPARTAGRSRPVPPSAGRNLPSPRSPPSLRRWASARARPLPLRAAPRPCPARPGQRRRRATSAFRGPRSRRISGRGPPRRRRARPPRA